MPGTHFTRGFAAELQKVAARAGLKMIRRLVASGDVAKAERLALTPGVLKKTKAGSQVKHLGSGMEGTATLIAHPKKGLAVRKIYDPHGASTPEMITRKATVGRKLSDSPDAAKFLGEMKTKVGPAHFYEHVPGQSLSKHKQTFARGTTARSDSSSTLQGTTGGRRRVTTAKDLGRKPPSSSHVSTMKGVAAPSKNATTKSMLETDRTGESEARARIKRLQRRGEKEGYHMGDLYHPMQGVHGGNVMVDARGRRSKVVDYLPTEEGKPTGIRKDVIKKNKQRAVMDEFDVPHELGKKITSGELMASAFRGVPLRNPLGVKD